MAVAGTSKGTLLPCPECRKIFRNESELLAHVLNHPEEEQFSCKLCEEKFDCEGQLLEHFIVHEEGFLTGHNVSKKKEKPLLIKDDFKKGFGLVSPHVAKAEHGLVETSHDYKEPEALVTRDGILKQRQPVEGMGISVTKKDKCSLENNNSFQCYLTNVENEMSLTIGNASEERKHIEHCFPKAIIKDLKTENMASKKHFLPSVRQQVSLMIGNALEKRKRKERFATKATEKNLQTQNDASENTSSKIAKRMLPMRAAFMREKCGEKFDRKEQIEGHSLNHLVGVSYVCGFCNKLFSEKTELEKHFLTHTKEECRIDKSTYATELPKKHFKRGPFTCKTCQVSFFEKHQLESHSHTHGESTLHVCFKGIEDERQLKQHSPIHATKSKYERWSYSVKRHLENRSLTECTLPHACQVCFKGFKNEQLLEQHSLIHIKNKYTCQVCLKSFETRPQLIKHLFVTHVTKTEYPFTCRVCSKQYATKRQLREHFHTHTDNSTHKCRVCDKTFARWSYLVTHMGVHTRHHVCDVCGVSFTQKSFLRLHKFAVHIQDCKTEAHMQSATSFQSALKDEKESSRPPKARQQPSPEKSFNTCEICLKVFSTKKDLLGHCLSHGGQRFACGVCEKSFSHATNLRSHFVVHENTEKFECLVCGKKFARKQELKSHSVTHTRERNFVCGACGKSFMRHQNLKQHCLGHKDDGILYRKNSGVVVNLA